MQKYVDYVLTLGDMELLPYTPSNPELRSKVYLQMDSQTMSLGKFSYLPAAHIPENGLIMGRMPVGPYEAVVDRWVLDAALQQDGILQNSISDISFFLNRELSFEHKSYGIQIVGITDTSTARCM